MRLNKYLAQAGVASRRAADRLIQDGTVMVNGVLETNPAYQAQIDDQVEYNGQKLVLQSGRTVIAFHKPKGVITTAQDPQHRKTVLDYLPQKKRLFPVGRLDKDTTGILLLTDDGELANQLLHPRHRVLRVYEAVIDRPFRQWEKRRLSNGVYIGQKEWGYGNVLDQKTVKKRTTVHLELNHGKKREVRRIMYRMKRELFSLRRIKFGPIKLGKLAAGEWRELNEREIKLLEHPSHNEV
ncbi:MAG: pseudouridine synthase [Fidelibacterota bacterium]